MQACVCVCVSVRLGMCVCVGGGGVGRCERDLGSVYSSMQCVGARVRSACKLVSLCVCVQVRMCACPFMQGGVGWGGGGSMHACAGGLIRVGQHLQNIDSLDNEGCIDAYLTDGGLDIKIQGTLMHSSFGAHKQNTSVCEPVALLKGRKWRWPMVCGLRSMV